MKEALAFLLLLAIIIVPANAMEKENVRPAKNVTLLIPDGTSLATISITRWLQWYQNPNKSRLNIDPYLCGTVRTHSPGAPTGDSALTTSCYMTGQPNRTGYVSTCPENGDDNDIYPADPTRALQPLTTVLEAGRVLQGKAMGLVFTCEFPHATPADCSAHSYNHGKYDWITPQIVHDDIDVVIGGRVSILTEGMEDYLLANGHGIYRNDLRGMRTDNNQEMRTLYGNEEMAYDVDRNPKEQPSIEEMTRETIDKLSKNPNGLFLMVEDSKIDWTTHGNGPVGMATGFSAFDRACGTTLKFTHNNGETVVVIVPGRGNSSISLGRRDCKGYDKLAENQLFHQLSLYKLAAEGFANKMDSAPNSEVQNIFRIYASFELTPGEVNALNSCRGYKGSPISEDQREPEDNSSIYSGSLAGLVAHIIASRTCFGLTAGGHTGEEIFLAAYHPQGTLPLGINTNIELNGYLYNLFGLTHGNSEDLTSKSFAYHTDVFEGYTCEIVPATDEKGSPALIVKNKKDKKKQLTITPFSSIAKSGKEDQDEIRSNSAVVYVDKNNIFYLPAGLVDFLK